MANGSQPAISREQLTAIRASEAIALFQAGQAGRTAINGGIGAFLSVAAIAGTAAVATKSPDALLPLPAFLLLLAAYVFQQYIDVTVLGQARFQLEKLVNAELPGQALIYESKVANIRKHSPLSRGVRALQVSFFLTSGLAIAGSAVIAGHAGSLWIVFAYAIGTALAAIPAVISFCDMRKTPEIARAHMVRELD
jgi:hypothetical protein